jgi:hypothetical protein
MTRAPLFLCCLSTLAAAGPAFGVDQLEALSRQGQTTELLARAREVVPADRTTAWNELLEKAALAEFVRLEAGDPNDAAVTVEGWLTTYRHLEQSRALGERHGALVGRAFTKCLEVADAGGCVRLLVARTQHPMLPTSVLVTAAMAIAPADRAERLVLAAELARRDARALPCDAGWVNDVLAEHCERASEASAEAAQVVSTCGARLTTPTLARVLESEKNRKRFCPALLAQPSFAGVQRARCERVR